MESLIEKVLLYDKAVEFKTRTYGLDASLTKMLWTEPSKDFDPRPMDYGFSGSNFGSGLSELNIEPRLTEVPNFKEKEIEGPGCVGRNQYELDEGWKLQERLDYSGHNGSGPHINYELVD